MRSKLESKADYSVRLKNVYKNGNRTNMQHMLLVIQSSRKCNHIKWVVLHTLKNILKLSIYNVYA